MNKIIIIGCPGSGKSTFAKALHKHTGLPLIHLDQLYWNPDRTHVAREMFLERLERVFVQGQWIIDGNYASTLERRLQACDTVFFLDYETEVCLAGVQARKGQARSDMPWVEIPEDDNEEFLELIRNYPKEHRPQVLQILKNYPDKKQLIFKSRAEADAYLLTL